MISRLARRKGGCGAATRKAVSVGRKIRFVKALKRVTLHEDVDAERRLGRLPGDGRASVNYPPQCVTTFTWKSVGLL